MRIKRFLSRADYQEAADRLACDVEAVIAISVVEGANRGAFDDDGFPTVLFEHRKFREYTGGRFDNVAPDLSNSKWGGYGTYSAQKLRLARARELDNDAALEAASWGLFQCMGSNWRRVGSPSLQAFVNGMCSGVDFHLRCLVAYFMTDNRPPRTSGGPPPAVEDLRAHRWVPVAEFYNGPKHELNHYAPHLAQAWSLAKQRSAGAA